jgi:predicted Zn-dependent protease with MMP-like domain
MTPESGLAPALEDIESLAGETWTTLPAWVRDKASDVVILVADFADDAMLDELGIDDAFELTGLYQGIPLTEKSASDPGSGPDTIHLFRRPILDEWVERGDVSIAALVRHVLIHELAHHFGWSDDDIARIDDWRA